MTSEGRCHKNYSVSFSVPDDRHHPRTFSFADSDWTYEPTISTLSPAILPIGKTLRSIKAFKKSWDADKAIRSTYKGLFGKYQLRAYLFLALGYGIISAWLTEMPTFALLSPKYIDCTPHFPNVTNQWFAELNGTRSETWDDNSPRIMINGQIRKVEPVYDYSKEYVRSVLTDFNILCNKTRLKLPYVIYILGLILGGLIFGYIADHSGRKMILLGSLWTACALSIFQLLSDDYISYIFFIFFLGITIGAVHVIVIPYVMEMFPIQSRAIYGLSLLGIVFLLNLVLPWLAFVIKNWKILQGVISVPLILTVALYWYTEESMFWYTSQRDYVTAVLSLGKIARFNGAVFEDGFREASDFLRGKRSKGIQCDFQPLLRLEDIKTLGKKYRSFDIIDLQDTDKTPLLQRILKVIIGHHYNPTLSIFYPTDIFHSSILSIYLLVMCGLWLVSSLTEYSLDAPHFTRHLTDDFFWNYFYTHLIQIISFIIAVPLVYKWGRRWPTFCFFLIAEVCLLGSVAVKLDEGQTRTVMLVVYFMGKFATRAAFLVIIIFTCEIFPTGLRCTTLGICYTFRLIGFALASPDLGELNGWMARLIYGILSLILGAMALLLPETKTTVLPRTMLQVESIPTSISKTFRRKRPTVVKRNIQSDGTRSDGVNTFNEVSSVVSGIRSGRPFDNQSTMQSVYELQEFGQDETGQLGSNRYPSRRTDLRNPLFYQQYSGSGLNNEIYRTQQPIVEDVEYDEDLDDDRRRLPLQRRLHQPQQQQLSPVPSPIGRTDDKVIILPVKTKKTSSSKQSSSDVPSQLETTAAILAGDTTADRSVSTSTTDETKDNNNRNKSPSQSPRFQRTMSQDENYFSEHC